MGSRGHAQVGTVEVAMPALVALQGRSLLIGAVVAVVLALAACGGGSPTPEPTPPPTPTAAPTPTPFDVADAFLAIIGDPDFSARMEIDGTMNMGVSATLSGTITGSGDDSRTSMKIELGTTVIETESIKTGGRSYSRTSPGPWLEDVTFEPDSDDAEDLMAWLRRLSEIEDLGVEAKRGQQLHHLSAGDEAVPPAALGLDSSTYRDPLVTIDFFAEDDGTPAIFAVDGSWVQSIAGQDFTVEFVMDLVLSNVGSAITIDPPTSVWTTYESPLGYKVAHPETFFVENREGYDAFVQDGADWIYVETWPDAAGLNEDGFLESILDLVKGSWGAPVETPVAATLGGEPGHLATFRFAYDDGSEGIAFDVLAMHDNLGWDVTLFSIPGSETADFALFQQFLATFAYVE
jgi:hypothetical protein